MKFLKKALAFLLFAVMLLPLASCASSSVTVIEYNGEKMTSNVFSYMLSENKSYLLAMYNFSDSADLWNTPISDGYTIGDNFKDQIIESAKNIIIAKALAKEYGITISDENKAAVQKVVDECIATYGSKAKWGMYLTQFGVNIEEFTTYMEDNYLVNQVAEYISSANGPYPIDEDALYNDYKKDYSYVQHILFNLNFKHKDESGNSVVMTDEEKAARRAELEELAEKMSKGEAKWEDYVSQNEDRGTTYLVTDDNSFVQGFQDAALDMKVGEYRLVETEYGFHLMNRLELTKEVYEEKAKSDYIYNLKNSNFMKVVEERMAEVVVNTEELNRFSVISAPVLS